LLKAAAFAAEQHRDQRRKGSDAAPYINHPIAVANVLANEAGIDDAEVLCAAMLHDTIEDTGTTEEELRAEFGDRVTDIVLEVTDDKALPKDIRKQLQIEHAPRLSREAKLVKLADKISNLRDIITAPPDWPVERKAAYFEWSAQVIAGLRGQHEGLETIHDDLYAARLKIT
jgi:guanosine-3',5'-bis(diphosphate) 3'-pyrophosphohydrolase